MSMQTNTETELSSVNSILGAIGQSPVTALDFTNPEISYAYQLLMECNLDTQNEGWVFNTEQDYPIALQPDKTITIPPNVLRMDQFDNLDIKRTDVVIRSRNGEKKLYDKFNHTYEFKPFGNTNTFRAEIIWLFPFEDLPSVFQRYITIRASIRAATQMVTNPELVKMLTTQEAYARASCMEYECNQADASMFGLPDGSSYRSYKPFHALRR